MTGGGWNVACGTVPEPLAAVGAGATIGVAAGEETTAGVLGALTDGTVLAEPVLAEPGPADRSQLHQSWLHQS